MIGILAFLGFAATIPAANWMIGHVGTCALGAACVIPVGLGLYAPSGVLMIGVALVLRDAVHELLGRNAALAAIAIGATLSIMVATPALAAASFWAFLLSEVADLTVYTPLRQRRLVLAVLLSGVAGAIVDSAVFLWLAFGSLEFMAGQVAGKLWMTVLALPVVMVRRRVMA